MICFPFAAKSTAQKDSNIFTIAIQESSRNNGSRTNGKANAADSLIVADIITMASARKKFALYIL